jgi:hypothetical protein
MPRRSLVLQLILLSVLAVAAAPCFPLLAFIGPAVFIVLI